MVFASFLLPFRTRLPPTTATTVNYPRSNIYYTGTLFIKYPKTSETRSHLVADCQRKAVRNCQQITTAPAKMKRLHFFTIICSIIHVILELKRCPALSADGLALLTFKDAVSDDPSLSLSEWNQDDDDPCRWPGVSCANITGFAYPRVVAISVSGKNLSGSIPSDLGTLFFLRRLNLHGNRLSGAIPPLIFNASSLHSLFLYDNLLSGPFPVAACDLPRLQNLDLSRNALSGPIPPALRGCRQLQRLRLAGNRFSGVIPAGIWVEMVDLVQLDLSSNEFEGRLPPDLGELDSLSGTLNLSYNRFSGAIPTSMGNLPSTVSLDLRYNNLTGEIPGDGSLANQSPTAFLNNPGLCGFPLMVPCEGTAAPAAEAPGGKRGVEYMATGDEGGKGMRTEIIVLISAADAAGVALVGLVVVCAYWKVKDNQKGRRKLEGGETDTGIRRIWWCQWPCAAAGEENREVASSGEEEEENEDEEEGGGSGGGVEGELVAMDKAFKVDLEELLRASAYVLGKGAKGIVYKVVVGDGTAVAVRRLGEGAGGAGRYKEFAAEVRSVGRVRHPNVVRVRAFYWAADEKLLITDFISNGNLAAGLRGRSGQQSLAWPVRLRIARGAARGLAHLHDCSPRKLVHGDLKPSNILIDDDFNPYISDFGLLRLLSIIATPMPPTCVPSSSFSSSTGLIGAALPSTSSSKSTQFDRPNPYRAPETRGVAGRHTQKSDVYSFGVVLLEMLTGKPPEMSSPSPPSGEQLAPALVKWVRKGFDEARPLSELVDPVLLREAQAKKDVTAAFLVALACTEMDPDARPRMKTVSEDLDRIGSSRK